MTGAHRPFAHTQRPVLDLPPWMTAQIKSELGGEWFAGARRTFHVFTPNGRGVSVLCVASENGGGDMILSPMAEDRAWVFNAEFERFPL